MAPIIAAVLTALPQLISGAKEIMTDKDAAKENLKSATTKAAALPVVAAGMVTATTGPTFETLVFDAVMAITALVLFLYRKPDGGTK